MSSTPSGSAYRRSGSRTSDGSLTYEATMAKEFMNLNPDKVHWERDVSFRSQPYRQLHHQRGVIGSFEIRLLEAAELERSYWSALALGPMKHLGLSKAHGPVTSYVTLHLDYQSPYDTHTSANHRLVGGTGMSVEACNPKDPKNSSNYHNPNNNLLDQKMPAKRKGSFGPSQDKSSNSSSSKERFETVTSPIIPCDSNPVWNDCTFNLPLRKGCMVEDGMRILLKIRVDEDATAFENVIPGVPSFGDDTRLLGKGYLDITSLCLGQDLFGQAQVGVLDAWVPIIFITDENTENDITHSDDYNQIAAAATTTASASKDDDIISKVAKSRQATTNKFCNNKITGRVRVLVSYRPNGLNPEERDYVALEAFARRSLKYSSCEPPMPSLLPLLVLERRGPYLKVQYKINCHSVDSDNDSKQTFAMRIHRNSCFVIERKNLLDTTIDLALLPTDIIMSTPIGKNTARTVAPIVNAGKELIMPAMLSMKLVWLSVRTLGFAGLAGAQAVGGTLLSDTAKSLTESSTQDAYREQQERASERIAQL